MGAVVVLAVRDLLFRTRLEGELRALELQTLRLPSGMDAPSFVRSIGEPPGLVIVDLMDAGLAPLDLVRELRRCPDLASVPVLGFAPHADAALFRAAREAGSTAVVSRGRLSAALPTVLAPFLPALRGPGPD